MSGVPTAPRWPAIPVAIESRPGIITTVGIFSIILGAIALLVNLCGLFFVGVVIPHVVRIGRATPSPVATPAPPPAVGAGEYVATDGLSAGQRRIVIAGLSQFRPLSDAREKQLDGLLADVGRKVIRLEGENLTSDRVAAYVSQVKEMPSDSGGPADDVFILASGRLQLSDQSAVFFPQDSPSGIRSAGGSYTDSQGTHLSPAQIDAVVQRGQSLCNQAMSEVQASALRQSLDGTTQTLVTPSASAAQAAGQVQSAQILGDRTIVVATDSGSISLGPTGLTAPGAVPLAAGMPGNFTPPHLARINATLLTLETVLSFLAAGLLLTIGIVTLWNSPRARFLHIAYAIGKILLAILSCYAIFNVAVDLGSDTADIQSVALAWMLIFGATGLIYPMALLIVMNLPSVREFFAAPVVKRVA